MSNLTVTQNFHTPQIAQPRGRDVSQGAKDEPASNSLLGMMDIWRHPEQYRSFDGNNNHSLNVLA
jgi:hypothetical protein